MRELYLRVFIEYDPEDTDQDTVESAVENILYNLNEIDGVHGYSWESVEDREL